MNEEKDKSFPYYRILKNKCEQNDVAFKKTHHLASLLTSVSYKNQH